MAGANGTGSASNSNPRKFSEKIAIQRQRQAEETAAFEEVMMDINSTRLQMQKLRMAHMRGPYYGGSLPNVNQIGSTTETQGPPHSPLDASRSTRHHGLVERVQRDSRRLMSPLRRYMRQISFLSPYNVSYLSPQQDSTWRRTNSDSALHTSVMNPGSQDPFTSATYGAPLSSRRTAFSFPAVEETLDGSNQLKPCDAKKMLIVAARPKSCEVPGINIFPSAEEVADTPPVSSVLNSGGSLPDLTSLHFPPPLPTPLDPDESGCSSLSGGSSTGNLTSTMTNLGIGLAPDYVLPDFSPSTMQNPLGRSSLQSSLSNPNLHSSLSNPSPTSSHSLSSMYSTPSFPSPVPMNSSPARRVPLSPLTLPLGGDVRRTHQFSPTMSPTLSSITQGVPLDTSKLTGSYHINNASLLHLSPQPPHPPLPQLQKPLHQHSLQPLHQEQLLFPSQQPLHQAHQSQQPLHKLQSSEQLMSPTQPAGQSQISSNQTQQLLHKSQSAVSQSQQMLNQHQSHKNQSQQPMNQSHQLTQPQHFNQSMQHSQQLLHQDSQKTLHQATPDSQQAPPSQPFPASYQQPLLEHYSLNTVSTDLDPCSSKWYQYKH
ncbi:hypothetical protein GDO86_019611 [Hymenochirus boettgeri]|uniref:Uncharacterized protein n=1 Tax=Hymenochirus boettgeri TaxID=247094 RepID=A0A8T2IGK4_9PIPI|nr:hypothetical protein GDO86_019611 [Hymenochirus boettgeri]